MALTKEEFQEVTKPHRWKPGESGNPEGRPMGARSKLGTQIVNDFLENWNLNGKRVLQEAADKDVSTYLRVACAILPKVIELDDDTKELIKEVLTERLPFHAIRERAKESELPVSH